MAPAAIHPLSLWKRLRVRAPLLWSAILPSPEGKDQGEGSAFMAGNQVPPLGDGEGEGSTSGEKELHP
jgi:hypothetical protein